jgi:hypothetical protein
MGRVIEASDRHAQAACFEAALLFRIAPEVCAIDTALLTYLRSLRLRVIRSVPFLRVLHQNMALPTRLPSRYK